MGHAARPPREHHPAGGSSGGSATASPASRSPSPRHQACMGRWEAIPVYTETPVAKRKPRARKLPIRRPCIQLWPKAGASTEAL